MSSFKLNDLLKIGTDALKTTATTLTGAVNELYTDMDSLITSGDDVQEVSTVPVNADLLEEHAASYFATADAVNTVSTNLGNVSDTTVSGATAVAKINTLNSNLVNLILDKLYPIGSIYLETTNTNPSSKLGGTWVSYGSSDTYLRLGGNGSGGSNTITTSNLPSHTHSIPALSGTAASNGGHLHKVYQYRSISDSNKYGTVSNGAYNGDTVVTQNTGTLTSDYSWTTENGAHTHTVTTTASTTGSTGSGTAFEPKYVGVYAWKRTA